MAFDLTFQLIEHRGDFSKLDPMQLAMSTLSGALGGAVSAKLAAAGARFLQTLIVNAISSGAIDGGLQLVRNAVEGMEILTPDGLVNIEDIEIGDRVLSDDPKTPGGMIAKQVTRTFERTTHSPKERLYPGSTVGNSLIFDFLNK